MFRTRFFCRRPSDRLFDALLVAIFLTFGSSSDARAQTAEVSGESKMWHPVVLTFEGPDIDEQTAPNPFLNYRFNLIVVTPSGESIVVPGYFAADGDAANSGATGGDKWRAIFTPRETGEFEYTASFRTGTDIAASLDANAGSAASFDGAMGSFTIAGSDKSGADFRGKGILGYVGERYLRFDDGDYYIKGGADSPENFLGYFEFDNTTDNGGSGNDLQNGLHRYQAHEADWVTGDPTWAGGKGKGIIGAVNYLAFKGVNSQYFLTMNVEGDGREVYPWTTYGERNRYDISKLDQWDVVFRHMTANGVKLHVLTQETENDQLLNGGNLGRERKVYYRELIARFGYHPALVWNLGEETTNTTNQIKDYATFIKAVDPYDHPVVVHTYPGDLNNVYAPLLGFDKLDGPSIQLSNASGGYNKTEEWVRRSTAAGRPWVVTLDEPGDASVGCSPDGANNNHRDCREQLWGNLFAGGGGVEWYFGYQNPHNDLDLEDYRSRDLLWDYTRYALEFMHEQLAFTDMETVLPADVNATGETYVFAQQSPLGGWSAAAVYAGSGTTAMDIPEGEYDVRWFDPRNGGALVVGSQQRVEAGAAVSLGAPPNAANSDWVVMLTRIGTTTSAAGGDSPKGFELRPAYPNPVAGASTVSFTLARTSAVNLSVFDMRGSLVTRLVAGTVSPGLHEHIVDGNRMASGVYLVRLDTEHGSATRSVIVL